MPQTLRIVAPEEMGLSAPRWQQVLQFAQNLCATGTLPGLSFQVQQAGCTPGPSFFGTARLQTPHPIQPETLFLVASLTKPVVAMAVLHLVEQGRLALNQRVGDFFPRWPDPAKRLMTIRHLLTHTSGLPDQLPHNQTLRQRHAPLSEFVAGAIETPLHFPVGRGVQYQSMGYALLGSIIEAASGLPFQAYLREQLFLPWGMLDTFAGLDSGSTGHPTIAEVRVPPEQIGGEDWNWNSPYWQSLGAPWGGLLSTAEDLTRFLDVMLQPETQFPSVLSRASIEEATANRLHDFPGVSDADRRTRGWGLGWRLNWKEHRHTFCDLLPAQICGHWGATGTLMWMDRARHRAFVALSTQPVQDHAGSLIQLSNLVTAAWLN
jgi:CubicO group peptidase (beta-lactamase class C family)